MSLFAIADTHLSFGTDKPMDSFNGWQDYTTRLENNWNKLVQCEDTVVIAGDISWAMNFTQLYNDFEFLNSLPGKKIIIKGNHDYWWNTMSKMNKFVEENNFNSISFLHNNSYLCSDISVCGSRGWFFDSIDDQDEKVLFREVQRIKTSILSAKSEQKAVFLHYPPISSNGVCTEIVDVLKEQNIKKCYFGHLHGSAAKYAVEGFEQGIDFKLISADRLSFTPLLISNY